MFFFKQDFINIYFPNNYLKNTLYDLLLRTRDIRSTNMTTNNTAPTYCLINENDFIGRHQTDNFYNTMVSHVLAIKQFVKAMSTPQFDIENGQYVFRGYTIPASICCNSSCILNKTNFHWLNTSYTEEEMNRLIYNEIQWHTNNPCAYWELPAHYYVEKTRHLHH
jgi:hypothetical protein